MWGMFVLQWQCSILPGAITLGSWNSLRNHNICWCDWLITLWCLLSIKLTARKWRSKRSSKCPSASNLWAAKPYYKLPFPWHICTKAATVRSSWDKSYSFLSGRKETLDQSFPQWTLEEEEGGPHKNPDFPLTYELHGPKTAVMTSNKALRPQHQEYSICLLHTAVKAQ